MWSSWIAKGYSSELQKTQKDHHSLPKLRSSNASTHSFPPDSVSSRVLPSSVRSTSEQHSSSTVSSSIQPFNYVKNPVNPKERHASSSVPNVLNQKCVDSSSSRTEADGEKIREEMVEMALHFLSHPHLQPNPGLHLAFLESKGLTIAEIQESINRMGASNEILDDSSLQEYDPIFLLPPSRYEEFFYKLHEPEASNLLEAFNSFINMFKSGLGKSYSLEDKSKMIHNQVNLLTEEMLSLYIRFYSKNKKLSDKERISYFFSPVLSECVEKYMMSRLYRCVFPDMSNPQADGFLFEKIRALSTFLRFEHLDISPLVAASDSLWSVAQKELLNINLFKCPREKLLCIVKACKIIFSALQLSCAKNEPVSADIFLPVLIYNLIKANPPLLISNVKFIQYFRAPSKMQYESGYFFVSFSTAVAFIRHLEPSKLTIDSLEYYRKMKEAHFDEISFNDTKIGYSGGVSMESNSFQSNNKIDKIQELPSSYDIHEHLLHCCAAGDIETCQELIEKRGARVDYVKCSVNDDEEDEFSRKLPSSTRNHSISKLSIIRSGDFPLSVACRFGNKEIVQYLLDKGADIHLTGDSNDRTVLHLECLGHEEEEELVVYNVEIIKLLLARGANFMRKDSFGKRPLDYAKHPEVIQILQEKEDQFKKSSMKTSKNI